jgi:hypothetical protein
LAWESACDDINGNSVSFKNVTCKFGNIFILLHSWPVFLQNLAAKRVNLAERYGFKTTRPFKAKTKPAYTTEKIEDTQLAHPSTPICIEYAKAGQALGNVSAIPCPEPAALPLRIEASGV